jgi:hypothetical protein
MKWNKFPDKKPFDNEMVLFCKCDGQHAPRGHHWVLALYNAKDNSFGDQLKYLSEDEIPSEWYSEDNVYWSSVFSFPCMEAMSLKKRKIRSKE